MDKPGFNNRERKFGFIETKFQYNRGHWKFFERSSQGVDAYEWKEGLRRFNKVQKKHYSTDFMFDRGIEFITRQMNKEGKKKKPFAMVISIADPHGENESVKITLWHSLTIMLIEFNLHIYSAK